MTRTVVSITNEGRPIELVRKSLQHIDVKSKIKPSFRVLVKPNLTRVPSDSPCAHMEGAYEKSWTPEGDVTNREVLEAILDVLHDFDVTNIVIAEGAGGCETPVVFESMSLFELADEFGAELVDLNHADSVKVPIERGRILDSVWIPKIVLDSDFRISLSVLKVHGASCTTLCLKNWAIGIPPCKFYGACKGLGNHYKGLEEPLPIHPKKPKLVYGQSIELANAIVDICSVQGYELGVVDGLTVQHYESLATKVFFPSQVERKNLILASTDMVAVDAVATRILGFDPEKILHIKWAERSGLGNADLSQIEIRGKRIEEVEMRCIPMYKQKEVRLPPLQQGL